ncbi:MAG TPA: lysylphosphatidylglycerol synthase transmembrane domain-containing protein, partial [Gemmatimonadales bacterium]|nr:lysylphosphatidylglycerol synthase transmembrane domain-containing protein [Gemmatimonadales bacterium]
LTVQLPSTARLAGLSVGELARRVGLAAALAFVLAALVLSRPHAFAVWIERVVPFRGLARRLVSLLEGIRAGLAALRSPSRLAAVVIWSVVIWTVNALSFLALFRAFGIEGGLAAAVLVQSAIVFGIAVPSSPGYVGVFEAAVVVALALFAVPQDQALAYAVTYHATTFLPIVLLGLYSLTRTPLGWKDLRS